MDEPEAGIHVVTLRREGYVTVVDTAEVTTLLGGFGGILFRSETEVLR